MQISQTARKLSRRTRWDSDSKQGRGSFCWKAHSGADSVRSQLKAAPTRSAFRGGRLPACSTISLSLSGSHRDSFSRTKSNFSSYGWLVDKTGFNVEDLMLAGVFLPPDAKSRIATLSQTQLNRIPLVCWSVLKALAPSKPSGRSMLHNPLWVQPGIQVSKGICATLVAVRYDPARARKLLDWAAPYWSGNRNPIPTTNWNKCAACRVNAAELCKVALVPYRTMI